MKIATVHFSSLVIGLGASCSATENIEIDFDPEAEIVTIRRTDHPTILVPRDNVNSMVPVEVSK